MTIVASCLRRKRCNNVTRTICYLLCFFEAQHVEKTRCYVLYLTRYSYMRLHLCIQYSRTTRQNMYVWFECEGKLDYVFRFITSVNSPTDGLFFHLAQSVCIACV